MKNSIIKLFIISSLMLQISTINAVVMWSDHSDGEVHQYTFVSSYNINWDEAANNAVGYGEDWHLATITSAEEEAFLEATLFSKLEGKYWLGAYQDPNQVDSTSGWNWITGEDWTYSNWGPEVNLDGQTGTEENYLITTNKLVWQWDDRFIDQKVHGYIIERHGQSVYVPEPTSLALFGIGLLLLGFVTIGQRRGQNLRF